MELIQTVIAGVSVAIISGGMGYLAREKMSNIEGKLDSVIEKVEGMEKRSRIRHRVVLNWLMNVTEEMDDIQPPEPVEQSVDFNIDELDDIDDSNDFMRGGNGNKGSD